MQAPSYRQLEQFDGCRPRFQFSGFMRAAELTRHLILELKSRKRMTQREIAEKIGMSEQSVSAYVKGVGEGKYPSPDADALLRLIELAGGSIQRALPDYDPDVDPAIIARRQEREAALARLRAATEETLRLLENPPPLEPERYAEDYEQEAENTPPGFSSGSPPDRNPKHPTPSKRRR